MLKLRRFLPISGLLASLLPPAVFTPPLSIPDQRHAPKRRRTGRRYPHSSHRQQARYARQIAAGRLAMDGVATERSSA